MFSCKIHCMFFLNVTWTLFVLQILKAPCLLLSLFTSLNLCSGKFGTPITDDVSKLSLLVRLPSYWEPDTHHFNSLRIPFVCVCANEVSALSLSPLQKQNIPSDYEIPVSYIPREVVRKTELTRNSRIHERLNISQRLLIDLIDFFFFLLPQAGTCWVVLNIYPLEQSLRKLADMFGAISSNKENIIVFIAMLKSLRFTFDHEELVGNQQLKKLENNVQICTVIHLIKY